ncbi:MAG: tRNA (guanosine(37)-N1)-methyltransferase TrmD [Alphaproteobacteria bacterium]|nr:tRNA (guanosine(37)-N1)-methyltransferase TrmD [Alphaproteobacteria bacterium]
MRFDLLTLHPELVRSPLEHSIIGRAIRDGHVEVGVHDLREHGLGRYRQVDDAPYGGGAGMVLKVDVLDAGIQALKGPESRVILMSPAGARFDQAAARRLACERHLVFVCGHYEGVDARVEQLVDEELSIGDYVLTGGELPALVILEAVSRLVPGVLGNHDSFQDESFSEGTLEHPQYTRPREYKGLEVPPVLLSGNHQAIADWREAQARARTRLRRPDLLGASSEES